MYTFVQVSCFRLPTAFHHRAMPSYSSKTAQLGKQQYQLKTTKSSDTQSHKLLRITGGSDLAVLYGAYRLAEELGIRFYLHGDIVPDEKIDFSLPELDEVARTSF